MRLRNLFAPSHTAETVWTAVESLGTQVRARVWRGQDRANHRTPVVLIHGLALSSRYMVPLGRRLEALGYTVYAPDMPGFGRSPKAADVPWPGGPSVRESADHLMAWMDAIGLPKATLFGDSIGMQIAVDIAARFPDRVDRLVLKGPTPDPRYRSALRQYPRVVLNMWFEAPSLRNILRLDYFSAGLPRMIQQIRRTVGDRVEERLPQVQAPTLVLRGRNDMTQNQDWAEQITAMLPNGRLVVVEGAAHNVHYSAPRVTADLMDEFLQGRLDAARPAGDDVVVPRLDPSNDPLAPPQPISTRVHGILDCLTGGMALLAPHLIDCGPRTRKLLTAQGMIGMASVVTTDYELGVTKRLPMAAHLTIDAATGIQLLVASATMLRREPAPGRWFVAALGAYEVFAAAATRLPMGPARLVPGRQHESVISPMAESDRAATGQAATQA